MRALRIVFASAALLTVSAFAADTQVKPSAQGTTPNIVVASAEKQVNVKQAPRVAKTEARCACGASRCPAASRSRTPWRPSVEKLIIDSPAAANSSGGPGGGGR